MTQDEFLAAWVAVKLAIDHPGTCTILEHAAANFCKGANGKMYHVTEIAGMTVREIFELRKTLGAMGD